MFFVKFLAIIYFFSQKFSLIFSVLFFIFPIAYYFFKRIPKVSRYITYKTVIYSTLLGAFLGVFAISFFDSLMISFATNSTAKYPIRSLVSNVSMAISACGLFVSPFLYWGERIKNGAKWWIVDMFYSLIIFFAASGLYITVYTFAEKHFSGIW